MKIQSVIKMNNRVKDYESDEKCMAEQLTRILFGLNWQHRKLDAILLHA